MPPSPEPAELPTEVRWLCAIVTVVVLLQLWQVIRVEVIARRVARMRTDLQRAVKDHEGAARAYRQVTAELIGILRGLRHRWRAHSRELH